MSIEAIIKPVPIADIVPPQEGILALAGKPFVVSLERHNLAEGVSSRISSPKEKSQVIGIHPEFKNVAIQGKGRDRLKYRRGSGRSRRCRIHGERHSSGNQCGGDGISKPHPFFIRSLPLKTIRI